VTLEAGQKLAHYDIVEPIGKGGMGEVYRATDAKLGRDVAIKVLPEEFAADEERLARFEREARVLASLNHPGIAGIHGFEESEGFHFLVLELVPGETLADRIGRSPVPVDEALDIATKISEALEEAHGLGIIHRDLKPANIKLTPDGKVKVLDFGLAKALAPADDVSAETSQSPTLTKGTALGAILGTASYMSPEQAKGKLVDKRADVWAFGVVLYEMLTGARPFRGNDISDTLVSVFRDEPDWDALPSDVPPRVVQAMRACLKKDAVQRARDVGDVRLAMEGTFETETPAAKVASRVRPRPSPLASGAIALLLVGVTGIAIWNLKPDAPGRVTRLALTMSSSLTMASGVSVLAISPDGARIVYDTPVGLYVRSMDQLEPTLLPGTESADGPFFSPDGEWIGFHDRSTLKKTRVQGGGVVTLCEAEIVWGAHWGKDGTILYARRGIGVLRVSENGGTPEVVFSSEELGADAYGPHALPGTNALLFTRGGAGMSWTDAAVAVYLPDTDEMRVLIEGGQDARYLRSGHLAYIQDEVLFAVPFDVDRLEVTGGAVPIVEHVAFWRGFSAAVQYGISDDGTLVYVVGGQQGTGEQRSLTWVDRDGNEEPLSAEPRAYTYPRISPDGSRLAIDVRDRDADIWIWHFAQEILTRFTFDASPDPYPTWTPDGKHLAFASSRDGPRHIYWKSADGAGAVEQLTDDDSTPVPQAFSPSGDRLVLRVNRVGFGNRLAVRSSDGSVEPLFESNYSSNNGEISPDGAFLAYQSSESGRVEIYVRPFPQVDGGKWQISAGGGTRPLWSPDGSEVFYLAPSGELMAVPIRTQPSFNSGNAEVLLGGRIYVGAGGSPGRSYDISPDGKHFLMIKHAEGAQSVQTTMVLVQNWFEELKRLAPVN